MAEWPSLDASVDLVCAVAEAGADVIELGMPFSDPLADGGTIQRVGEEALAAGATFAGCCELVSRVRARGVTAPLVVMGYYNPVLVHTEQRWCSELAAAGADGLIVPDLPLEESSGLARAARDAGLALIQLVAPTTDVERARDVAAATTGFLYCVSLTGVTGARGSIGAGVGELVQRMRSVTDAPVLLGFGIATVDHVRHVAPMCDGVVVGSALIDAILNAPDGSQSAAAHGFVSGFVQAAALEVD